MKIILIFINSALCLSLQVKNCINGMAQGYRFMLCVFLVRVSLYDKECKDNLLEFHYQKKESDHVSENLKKSTIYKKFNDL